MTTTSTVSDKATEKLLPSSTTKSTTVSTSDSSSESFLDTLYHMACLGSTIGPGGQKRGQMSPDLMPQYDNDSSKPVFGVLPDYEHPIRYAKKGILSEAESPAQTVGTLFHEAVAKFPNDLALAVERPCPEIVGPRNAPSLPDGEWTKWQECNSLLDGEWTKWTWKEYERDCMRCAKAYLALGVPMHASVTPYGFNAPEWHISSVACMLSGIKIAGIYPTDTVDQVFYKASHANSYVAVIEDMGKLKKYMARISELPNLKALVLYGVSKDKITEKEAPRTGSANLPPCPIYHWDDFLKLGDSLGPDGDQQLTDRSFKIRPGHCAAIVYTSGTTGNPKGVMISHDNLCSTVAAVLNEIGRAGVGATPGAGNNERLLSYLPLSHVAGFLIDIMQPMAVTARLKNSYACYFARTYDLKEGTLRDRLAFVKPTVFFGVPRVWEKFAEAIRAIGATITGIKKIISTKLKAKLVYWAKNQQIYGNQRIACCHNFAMKKMMMLKERLGLDKAKICATGAAPLSVEYLEYFGSLGIQIFELYGMSESTGMTTFSSAETHRWGSIGYAPMGYDVRVCKVSEKPEDNNKILSTVPPVSNADDSSWYCPKEEEQGELCFRGRHIMMGYLANPAFGAEHVKEIEKKTREAIDDEGYMHSGDKGLKDSGGMFKITGRYKELLIGAGGENIAPIPIEENVKMLCQAISNAMMVGDKMKYNTMIVTLKVEGANGERPGTNILTGGAKILGAPENITTVEDAMKSTTFKQAIQSAIDKTNSDPQICQNNAFKVQKFIILPVDFSLEGEELTPTMKAKRGFIVKKYEKEIMEMYGE